MLAEQYRIDLPRSDVLRMVESQQFEMLQRFDQVRFSPISLPRCR